MVRNSKAGSQATTDGNRTRGIDWGDFLGQLWQRLTDGGQLWLYGLSTDRNIEHAVGWRVSADQACGLGVDFRE